jgi:uncharacterized membrane protein (DUF2068 family)
VDWSLLACGRSGHITYAPDEPPLREQLSAAAASGEAWCCLRCAAFVPGPPQRSGPAADAPAVRRGVEVRSTFILRVFAVERFLRAVLFGTGTYVVLLFRSSRQSVEQTYDRLRPGIRTLFRELGYNIDHSKLAGLIQHALTLSPGVLALLAVGLGAYAVIEIVEGTGLWLARRWGEYFAMVATSVFLPLEIYDLVNGVTVTRVVFFLVNLVLVLYLVITKRLFGVRGGKRAYQARLRSESVMDAAARAAAGRAAAAGSAGQPRPAVTEPGLARTATAGQPRDGSADPPARDG